MADQERRTTTPPPVSPGPRTDAGTHRRKKTSSTIWLVVGVVLAILLALYLFNGGMNSAGDADGDDATNVGVEGGATDAVEGAADAVPGGTDAGDAPATEPPAN